MREHTFNASISPSLDIIFRLQVALLSAATFTLASNLSICFQRLSSCFRISISLSAKRFSASFARLSKSTWIWLSCFRRVMRLSWKTEKLVKGLVSAELPFFYTRNKMKINNQRARE